jgi:hypothetical protein
MEIADARKCGGAELHFSTLVSSLPMTFCASQRGCIQPPATYGIVRKQFAHSQLNLFVGSGKFRREESASTHEPGSSSKVLGDNQYK